MSQYDSGQGEQAMILNSLEYFECRGLNILVFSNWYNDMFSDSKISGVEIIHHGIRTVTNGDLRLEPTPVQWAPIPEFKTREVDQSRNTITVHSSYPEYDFDFTIHAEGCAGGVTLSIEQARPLPPALEGIAGFNLEFLPAAYAEKGYLADGHCGVFPTYPSSQMDDSARPLPFASGRTFVLAPEDPERCIRIESRDGMMALYDGRNMAQNGWFVLRGLLPADTTGEVLQWRITGTTIPNWTREPVIAHSQVGYHPRQDKVAVIEFDKNDKPGVEAHLLHVLSSGTKERVYSGPLVPWGKYTRYQYYKFDFSHIDESGLYLLQYGDDVSEPFRIDQNVYADAWQPTLDVFFPVQMDHVRVREAYRIWHGLAHMDDAIQAPVNHEHFDLYAQGPTTDTRFSPGEHIPGLNVGGWFDAGDYDIRTQTQYAVVSDLVRIWEDFTIDRDQTTVDQELRYVEIHRPDGKPDLLQQIEHGVLALLAQYRAVGHAIPGIIVANLSQYTHLGDGSTQTDNIVADSPGMIRDDRDGFRNSDSDDRWAFTSRTSALTYGSAAALAAASRALSGYNDELAAECLETAEQAWDEEKRDGPHLFRHGNTTGGVLEAEELAAVVELLISTREQKYAVRISELWPDIERSFGSMASLATSALPYMNVEYEEKLRSKAQKYRQELRDFDEQNPFGVPISTGGWAGNGQVIRWAITNYHLSRAFPDLFEPELVFRGLNYIYGCHPDSSISFVSGVGAHSKRVAYGTNRADFTYIAGGVVPGVLIIKPDFPENKEDWPFLWGENEYVVNIGAEYIYLVCAANELAQRIN
jgi:endoglucanase